MENQNNIIPMWDIVPDTQEKIQTQIERMKGLIEEQWFILGGCPSALPSNEVIQDEWALLLNETVQDEFLPLVQNLTESKIINSGE